MTQTMDTVISHSGGGWVSDPTGRILGPIHMLGVKKGREDVSFSEIIVEKGYQAALTIILQSESLLPLR